MIIAGKNNVDELNEGSFRSQQYKEVPTNEEWRIGFTMEMMDILHGKISLDDFSWKEIKEILHRVVVFQPCNHRGMCFVFDEIDKEIVKNTFLRSWKIPTVQIISINKNSLKKRFRVSVITVIIKISYILTVL